MLNNTIEHGQEVRKYFRVIFCKLYIIKAFFHELARSIELLNTWQFEVKIALKRETRPTPINDQAVETSQLRVLQIILCSCRAFSQKLAVNNSCLLLLLESIEQSYRISFI